MMHQRKNTRVYDARMPRESQQFHNAMKASPNGWRPLTTGGVVSVEPGTMWNIPIAPDPYTVEGLYD